MDLYTRSGIVPYFRHADGEFIFCFGIDRKSRDISDWGGTMKNGENIYTAACRELNEESYGHITIDPTCLENVSYVRSYEDKLIIFFVEVEYNLIDSLITWMSQRKRTGEMIGVQLMSYIEIPRYAKKFYSPVYRALYTGREEIYRMVSSGNFVATEPSKREMVTTLPYFNNK